MLSYLRTSLLLCALTVTPAICAVLSLKDNSLSRAYNLQVAKIETPPSIEKTEIPNTIEFGRYETREKDDQSNNQLARRGCKTRQTEEITSYYVIKGDQDQMSSDECGPGTISDSVSRTFQRGFAVSLGVFHPTSYLGDAVEKLVPTGQFSQASGTVTTTGYSLNCLGGAACILYFQPYYTVSEVKTYTVSVSDNGSLCSSDDSNASTGQYTTPMTNVGCEGTSCSAAGIWGVCYTFDFGGEPICPGQQASSLPGIQCPSNFAASPNAPN